MYFNGSFFTFLFLKFNPNIEQHFAVHKYFMSAFSSHSLITFDCNIIAYHIFYPNKCFLSELKIHLSPHTKAVLDDFGIFNMKKRRHSVHLKVTYINCYSSVFQFDCFVQYSLSLFAMT